MFQFAVYVGPWEWQPAKYSHSGCYSPIGHRNTILAPSHGHQSQAIKETPQLVPVPPTLVQQQESTGVRPAPAFSQTAGDYKDGGCLRELAKRRVPRGLSPLAGSVRLANGSPSDIV